MTDRIVAPQEKLPNPRKSVVWDCGMTHHHKSYEEAKACQQENYAAITKGRIKLFKLPSKAK